MSFRAFLAVSAGKTVRLFCRILHRGGTAKPGEIALHICPNILSELSANVTSIIVTGTNGKTTCTRIVEEGLHQAGLNCFSNKSGANLLKGIVTDFVVNSTLSCKCKYDYAVLETDEAASKKVCEQLNPKVIFVTNLFRDQVDRFGGVVNTRDCIRAAISNSPNAVLVLNADCPVTASLADNVPNKSVFFGLSENAARKCVGKGVSDLTECILCGSKYEYSYVTFSHLGGFRCPNCGARRPVADYEVTDILSQSLSGSTVQASVPSNDGTSMSVSLDINLPAVYNIYNALGAYAAISVIGISSSSAALALKTFKCGFGRMEPLNLGEKGGKMILVKNDAGCNQVIQFLRGVHEDFVLSIYLNNNISDGVDISWLENVEFEFLNECPVQKIYVSGMRIEEMYQRLLKAGIPENLLFKEPNKVKLVKELKSSKYSVFIMPTYTGMMEVRSEIIRQCGGSEFWEG